MNIHFIGIGGIGVSALARYYLAKRNNISGSDLVSSEITDDLKKLGVKIFIGKEKPEDLTQKYDLIIHSPAVIVPNPVSNILSYPEALGELTKKYFTIAVSGTHGKTTTTAMLGLILIKAKLDPTIIIGTKLKELGNSNCRVGKSEYLLIEADEHMASFLNYWPKMIVLTNIHADHLDYYKNLNNVLKTFKKYISHLPKTGFLIANKDDENIKKIFRKSPTSIAYSLKQPEAKKLRKILKIPGEHNVCNALAALTAARALGVPDKISFKALSKYKGAWRRLEIVKTKPYILISDYGHNPQKVMAGLKAIREKYPKKEIWCVYQPHQYQRTYFLFKEFVKTFRKAPADKIIITDIYDVAGREEGEIKNKVNSEKLVNSIKRKNVIYVPKEKLEECLKNNFKNRGVLIIMGAGDIYNLILNLLK